MIVMARVTVEEVGSLSLDHIIESSIEENVESTQAPKSVREIVRKPAGQYQ